jgi:trimeric autotransporter adhesin
VSPGTTTITATLGSITASATLKVTNATIVRISVGPPSQTIYQATRLPFTATGLFSDHTTQNITNVSTWNSDDSAVAKIGNTGVATALGPGTANISATFDGVTGSTPLYVSPATITSISVTPVTALLAPATSVNCRATATFSDGSTLVITNYVTWTSSASTVASVSPFGAVTALSGGIATISAQFGSVSGESTITVDATPLTSIQISPPTASIAQQTGVQLHAIGTFADGNTQDLTNFALWTSSAPSVATINEGFASGLESGTATIVALFGGQAGTADLTVTSAAPASQVVSRFPIHFEQDGFTQSSVLADFSDGTTKDLSPWVTWTSSSADTAAVAAAGFGTTTGAGTTGVTAPANRWNGTAALNGSPTDGAPQEPIHALP